MAGQSIPKLVLRCDPGQIIFERDLDIIRSWPNQTEVEVAGIHFVQEDSGPEIGQAITQWLAGLV